MTLDKRIANLKRLYDVEPWKLRKAAEIEVQLDVLDRVKEKRSADLQKEWKTRDWNAWLRLGWESRPFPLDGDDEEQIKKMGHGYEDPDEIIEFVKNRELFDAIDSIVQEQGKLNKKFNTLVNVHE